MLALLEMISFHLALFFSASILFVLKAPMVRVGPQAIVVAWLLFCGLSVLVVSLVLRAHVIARWKAARPHGAALALLAGHAAPVLAGLLFQQWVVGGTGSSSGLALLPLMAWAVIFYGLGIVGIIKRLTSAAARGRADAPADTGPV